MTKRSRTKKQIAEEEATAEGLDILLDKARQEEAKEAEEAKAQAILDGTIAIDIVDLPSLTLYLAQKVQFNKASPTETATLARIYMDTKELDPTESTALPNSHSLGVLYSALLNNDLTLEDRNTLIGILEEAKEASLESSQAAEETLTSKEVETIDA